MSATAQTLDITALGHRGEGVAHTRAGPVFVAGTLPGETVTATVSGQRGTLETVLVDSPDRITPFCPHFGTCGGCQVQHLAPGGYRAWKRGLVVHALEVAGLDAPVADLVDAHGPGRRRATMHGAAGRAGFAQLRSHTIADLDHCPILVPALAQAPQLTRAIAEAAGPCDVSLTASETGLDAAIRTRSRRAPKGLAGIAERFDLARVALNGDVVLHYRAPTVSVGRARVTLPVASFLQATEAAEVLLAEHVLAATPAGGPVADLFCGLGPFALRLAQTHAVHAVDSDRDAVAALDAAHRATKKLKPLSTDVRDLFADPLSRFELDGFATVVLDPPRAGAKAQVEQLARSKVSRVISVSCDPKSFARDARILVDAGFRLESVTPFDQFAFSSHTEVVGVFNK